MTDPPRADPRVTVVVDREPLDIAAATEAVSHPQCGGIGVFLGVVRDHHEGEAVDSLDYEAWEDRAVSEMRAVGEGVVERFPGVRAVHLAHRLGHLEIGEPSVIVAASAPHRAEALDACRALIEDLKVSVPIWKHEHLADGTTRWPGSPGP